MRVPGEDGMDIVPVLAACGGGSSTSQDDDLAQALGAGKSVTLVAQAPNLVSRWHEVATTTVNVPSTPTGATPEERVGGPDLATVQIAVYDAAMAIARGLTEILFAFSLRHEHA